MELLTFARDSHLIDGNSTHSAQLTDSSNAVPLGEIPLFEGYSSSLLTFASATCIVFILVGLPGNLITIIALARCKKVRNATAVFIINLSLSDLLFCCFNLPLAASTFWNRRWIHKEFVCELFPLMRYGLLAVSLFTVLAITINRYVMIGHPRIYPRVYRRKYLGLMVAATWIGAFTSLIPTWRGVYGKFGLDQKIGSCSILLDSNQKSPKEFLFAMAFVVPCVSIIVCYARIFYIVRKTAMRTHENAHVIPAGSIRIQEPAQQQKSNNRQNKTNLFTDEANKQLLDVKTNENRDLSVSDDHSNNYDENHSKRRNKLDTNSETSSSNFYPHGTCGSKILLKYIDSSMDSDLPPSLTGLRLNRDEEIKNDHIKGVEFVENDINQMNGNCDTELKRNHLNAKQAMSQEADSAMEESISSVDNNQVEPSSSSGIDLPLDEESPPSRRFTKSFSASLRRLKKSKDKTGALRKHSTMNTSGASILYVGRMTAKDRRLLKMILVIFVSFLICYLPITITKIIKPIEKYHFWNVISYLLIYLTTCINPIIYVVMSSEYRQAYWNLLMCRTKSRANQQKELVQKQGSQRT
ncbi:G-protein coupled receptor moody isoform X2 [Bradysia coprophila]|uniref:G-protein coupled receptor moody isoform X2 n=1 Tax=Bradysia coprophila TaxID=38358 RepID=UPI00187DAF28|nr:G-protein coupled receptor moody isoform X2 [Bradysia coprophila]